MRIRRYPLSPLNLNGYSSMDFRHRGSASARMVIGLLIIALGVVYLADAIGVISAHRPERFFFPAAFAAIGFTILIEKKNAQSLYWAYGWLIAAFIEFAYQAYWIPFGIGKLIFPLILLLIGARLIQRATQPASDISSENSSDSSSDRPNDSSPSSQTRIVAVLAGSQSRRFSQPLKDAEVIAILSGVKLDLTNAQIEGERATLQVTAVMGGIEIYAPSDWTIVSDVTPILGAYIDKRRPSTTLATKTLFISGFVVMGGIEVKN